MMDALRRVAACDASLVASSCGRSTGGQLGLHDGGLLQNVSADNASPGRGTLAMFGEASLVSEQGPVNPAF